MADVAFLQICVHINVFKYKAIKRMYDKYTAEL